MEKEEKEQQNASFEEAVKELESIVNTLEAGEVSLEESLKLFQRGVFLTNLCNKKLTEAEGVVKILYREDTGELREMPFGEEEEKELRE